MKVSRRNFIRNFGFGLMMILMSGGRILLCPFEALANSFPSPTKKDRCPVCGMFVYKYPYWRAGFVFKDGVRVFHCSPKCFFHNLGHVSKYQPVRTREDIKLLWVTDYYTANPVDAQDPDVRFVSGSTLVGPMGWDVVPVKGIKAAETFKRDYFGQKILCLDEVTEEDIEKARKGGGRKTRY